jgi:thiol-disulfide isomerase/thioredoxin
MENIDKDNVLFFKNNKYVKELTSKDFDANATWKLKDKGCNAVLFYANWCPHCVKIKGEWENFGKLAGFTNVCSFNSEVQKAHLLKIKEDMPELVKGFPTIIYYLNGEPVEQHEEQRTSANFLKTCMKVCKK